MSSKSYKKIGHPRGERHGRAKLTEKQVLDARKNYVPNSAQFGAGAYARRYGVFRETMRAAIYGRTWKHLPKVGKYDGNFLEKADD